jgi:hypothetical protein
MSHGRRLFCEALLFSWSHERPGCNPPQHLLVPRKELAELRADIGSLFLGHPSECTSAQSAPSSSLPVPRICRNSATLGLCHLAPSCSSPVRAQTPPAERLFPLPTMFRPERAWRQGVVRSTRRPASLSFAGGRATETSAHGRADGGGAGALRARLISTKGTERPVAWATCSSTVRVASLTPCSRRPLRRRSFAPDSVVAQLVSPRAGSKSRADASPQAAAPHALYVARSRATPGRAFRLRRRTARPPRA